MSDIGPDLMLAAVFGGGCVLLCVCHALTPGGDAKYIRRLLAALLVLGPVCTAIMTIPFAIMILALGSELRLIAGCVAIIAFFGVLIGGYGALSALSKKSPSIKALLQVAEAMRQHNTRKFQSS